jgi:cytochrome c553
MPPIGFVSAAAYGAIVGVFFGAGQAIGKGVGEFGLAKLDQLSGNHLANSIAERTALLAKAKAEAMQEVAKKASEEAIAQVMKAASVQPSAPEQQA